MPPSITSTDVYQIVTDKVTAAIQKAIDSGGGNGWLKPWVGAANAPRNLQSGKQYRGINSLLLSEFFSGYSDPRWTTFNAARKMGGKVRKGEKSTLVTLWKRLKVKDANAPDGEKMIAMLRYFRVFNVAQIDWPEGVLKPIDLGPVAEFDPNDEAEKVLLDYIDGDAELSLRWGGSSAYYMPAFHSITLPDREQFKTTDGFYGTAFHECAHSTHKRLGRKLGEGFGSDPYAREELVAEMTSAFVCASLGVDGQFNNSVAYLKGWLSKIGSDPKLIVQAAGKAQKAADLILGQMITEDAERPPEAAAEPQDAEEIQTRAVVLA